MPPPDASVVICTRDRVELLQETLAALLALDAGDLDWEIVVVDNASSDGTQDVVQILSGQTHRTLKLVREETLGLSTARNTGIASARGQIITFLDDDAIPWPDWLPAMMSAFLDDRVYAAGGPVEPRFTSNLPEWFSDRFLPYLTVWDLGPEPIELHYNEYPRGANMAFRREAFERFGLFSTHLGRKAKSLLSCEETELCLRIERGGESILYVPEAGVDHIVEGNRATADWLRLRFGAQGASEAIVEWQHAGLRGLLIGFRRSLLRAMSTSWIKDT